MLVVFGFLFSGAINAQPYPVLHEVESTGAIGATPTVKKPSNVVAGNLLIIDLAVEHTNGLTITPPSGAWGGWTTIDSVVNAGEVAMVTYWRIAGGAEPPNYKFTLNASSKYAISCFRITGHHPSMPIHAFGDSLGASGNVVAPSITTTIPKCLVFAFYSNDTTSTSYTPPAGTTEIFDLAVSFTISLMAATYNHPIGPTGVKIAIPTASAPWAAQQVAVRPVCYLDSLSCPPDIVLSGCNESVITSVNSGFDYSVTPVTIDSIAFVNAGGSVYATCDITITYHDAVTDPDCPTLVTRTFTVVDEANNIDSCMQLIEVRDTLVPVITCPPDTSYEACTVADLAVLSMLPYAPVSTALSLAQLQSAGGDAFDNCGILDIAYSDVQSGSCPVLVTRTFVVTDSCNNISQCLQKFLIYDTIAPLITCPPNDTINCLGDLPVAYATSDEFKIGGGNIFDNCGIVEATFNYSDSIVNTSCPVVYRSYFIEDSCGNMGSCEMAFTIDIPDFPMPNDVDTTVFCKVNAVQPVPPAVNDFCGSSINPVGPVVSDTVTCEGNISYTWTYSDCAGNTHDWTYTYHVVVPDFTMPADQDTTVNCIADAVQPTPPTVQDSCGNVINPTGPQIANNITCEGDITYTWTYEDCVPHSHDWTYTCHVVVPDFFFVDPPSNVSLTCQQLDTFQIPVIVVSNGLNGVCGIIDTVSPTIDSLPDICGSSVVINWMYTDSCNRTITTSMTLSVEPPAAPAFVNPPADTTITCSDAETFAVPDLMYSNNSSGSCLIEGTVQGMLSGSFDICGGAYTIMWQYTDTCGRSVQHIQHITIEPAPPATFINPPGDTAISCGEAGTFAVPDLSYTNNETGACEIFGSVPGVLSGSFNSCGGSESITWEFTDSCGNTISHIQNITIEPASQASFINPPSDTTITCGEAGTFPVSDLSYTNNETGACEIFGSVPGVLSGSFNSCGGSESITWEFTDSCGNTISHIQNITIEPASQASFINPPSDTTITCGEAGTFPVSDLSYTNNETGACEIFGSVPGVLSGSFNACGGTESITWEFADSCGNMISHTQNITVEPASQASFINPPSDTTITCGEAGTFPVPDLSYTNNETGACEISGSVPGVLSGSFNSCGGTESIAWEFTDSCGNTISHTQNITIQPAPQATFINPPADTTLTCADAESLSIPDLNYTNNESGNCEISGSVPGVLSGSYNTCGGTETITWEFTDSCGNTITHIQNITIQSAAQPSFVNPPADTTLTCEEADAFVIPDLSFTNNQTGTCEISGTVPGVLSGSFDICGGTQTVTWEFTDSCGNTISYTQNITAEPAPEPAFINPPANESVSCGTFDPNIPDLTVSNGLSGSCAIDTIISGTQQGSGGPCGSVRTRTWEYTDPCGRTITYQQIITTSAAEPPVFVNPPADTTLSCEAIAAFSPDSLFYTNSETGACELSGTVPPVLSGSHNVCGGAYTVTWIYSDSCDNSLTYVQNITVQPSPPAAFINPPADTTLSCEEAGAFPVLDLSYTNAQTGTCEISGSVPGTLSGSFNSCGGSESITWEFTDSCGNTISHTQNITIQPAPQAAFINPPADTTLTCADAELFSIPDLNYTNNESGNCEISGSVPGVLSGSFNSCGGSESITWEFTDSCGNTISYTQNITIQPAPQATFINPPADTTLTCADAELFSIPDLNYTNNESGNCEISGSVPGVLSGSFNSCGGSESITWEFTDSCGNTISYTQNITIQPAPQATFINPPADTTLTCADAESLSIPDLNYTNNESGNCEISGSVPGVLSGSYNTCGGTETITWEFTDSCGNTITHIQNITIQSAAQPSFVNPPADTTLTCEEADAFVIPDLSFTNNQTGTCEISGTVPGVLSGSFDICGGTQTVTWEFTDSCGNTISYTQNITAEPAPEPAFINPPANESVSCGTFDPNIPDLTVSNGLSGSCAIDTIISGTQQGSGGPCGSVRTRTWEYTDPCGRTITYQQIITTSAAEPPVFVNPPVDTTLSCEAIAAFSPDSLFYTNSETGACELSGTVPPVLSGSHNVCGGAYTVTWTYSDSCDNSLTYVQNITVQPAPPAAFINPPADTTLSCEEAGAFPVLDLSYTNAQTGTCEISGSVPGTLSGSFNSCGGSESITWEFTDSCGNVISHTQNITIEPAPQPAFINLPADTTLTCEEAEVFVIPDLSYTNGQTGACEISGSVPGVLNGSFDVCGGTQSVTWEFTDSCGNMISYTQNITIDQVPAPVFINPPGDTTLTCEEAATLSVPDLNYSNGLTGACEISGTLPGVLSGSFNACGGTQAITWEFTDSCGNMISHTQNIVIEPAPQPAFVNPPADTTLSCSDATALIVPDLSYTNGQSGACEISGTVPGVLSGSFNTCGGSEMITWEFTDSCGNMIIHTQNIIVEPAPAPVFVNTPADTTLTCEEAGTFPIPVLSYTNNETGTCQISGSVPGVLSGSFNTCGGTQMITWEFTDSCGNMISYTQNITIEPAAQAAFISPPGDTSITCEEAGAFAVPDLSYSNGQSGACEISGSVPGVLSGSFNACGGTESITWEFTDSCGNTISYTQNITIQPAPQPAFVNPPADTTMTCEETGVFPVSDLNYTNDQSGVCEISGSVPGVLSGSFNACGGTESITWEFTDSCGNTISYTQNITIQPAPQPAFVNPPADTTLTCEEAEVFVIPDLSYTNGQTGACEISGSVPGVLNGSFDVCGGTQSVTWEFTDSCGNMISYTQNITIDQVPAPVFINPPGDTTLTCDEAAILSVPDLNYSNGLTGACEISGTIPGVLSGSYNACGGTESITWEFTDSCGNTISHTQNITIQPAPQAVFINPPADTTLTCADAESFSIPDLNYTNNESGNCEISGSVPGVLSGSFNTCGGSESITWEFTDSCGNTITHTQNITIEPAPQASFIDPPADTMLTCGETDGFIVPDLSYSNNETGNCEISGSVPGMLSGSFNVCGGTESITWEFTDSCGNLITHTQTITVEPAPQASFIDPPADTSITCEDAGILSVPDLSYTNNETGTCQISGSVPGVLSGSFNTCGGIQMITWEFTDSCGNMISYTQNITIEPAAQAAFISPPGDTSITCEEAGAFAVPDLSYSNGQSGACEISGTVPGVLSGSFNTCGGSEMITWEFTDSCGNMITHTQNIIVEPAPAPVFVNTPADTTLTCEEAGAFPIPVLSYTNNETGTCQISGSVPGVLSGSFNTCGGTQMITWEFTDSCGNMISYTQNITIEPAAQAAFISPPGDTSITCEEAGAFAVPDLSYSNGQSGACEISGSVPGVLSGSFNACGGTESITWEFTDSCGNTISYTQNITIQPAPQPAFVNPPADTTLTCEEAEVFVIPDLSYTNEQTGACEISGTIPGVMSGSYNACGGTESITWEFTDSCGNMISYTQNITIDQVPAPVFINPPGDTTLTCDEAAILSVPDLNYSNGLTGACEISGTIPGVLSGSYNACGGTESITWEFTDSCGNMISHTQNIVIEPAPQPAFVNPPADTTLSCSDATALIVPDLSYTNGQSGACEISGTVPGVLSGSFNTCGGSEMITWEFTDSCGNMISYTQNITIDQVPAPVFINPPGDTTLTCDEAAILSVPDLNYSNGLTGACEISGTIPGVLSGSYNACGGTESITWEFTDSCGNSISHTQTITVQPAPQAAFINPPVDTMLTCGEAAALGVPDLNYSNGQSGACQISGTVPGVLSGSYNACGGTESITWEFTDSCGNTISYTQNITIQPAPQPAFVNPPADTTLTCEEAEVFVIPDLSYTNGQTGACEISGSVPGILNGSFDVCGGTQSVAWEFTDSCGNMISYTQNITIDQVPAPVFINPPGDTTLTCDEAAILSVPDLNYSNGLTGACEISGTIPGVLSGSYNACGGTESITWEFADSCGNMISHTQNIVIEPAPQPAFVDPPADTTLSCSDATALIVPDLSYTNGQSGACESSGTVPGVLSGSFNTCGGSEMITWEFTDSCGNMISYTQNITIDQVPAPVFINPPGDTTLTCDEAAILSVPDLNYSNGLTGACEISGTIPGVLSGSYNACGGTESITWEFTDSCGNSISHTQTITVQPAPQAAFINPPVDTMFTCGEAAALGVPDLNYSNGQSGACQISGTVPGVLSGSYNACGGTESITWEFTDSCGNTISYTQNITIQPAPQPAFVNPPADTTLTCEEAEVFVIPDLSYTNGQTGACEISGSVPGILNGSFDVCGGTQSVAWEFTDSCGNMISYTQNITIDQVPAPVFINPPGDTTLTCDEAAILSVPDLNYSNGLTGACEISGTIPGVMSGSYNACGGTESITWEFTDSCGNLISYTQNITIDQVPAPVFINPPGDTTLTCDEAAILSVPDLNYSNGLTGACEISGTIPGVMSGSYNACGGTESITWEFTDSCGNSISHTQTITVQPAPQAAFINPPVDTMLTCGEAAALGVPDLNYSNGQSGACQISGTVPGVLSGSYNACGGTESITWEFTDSCGNLITHTQNITIEPAPAPVFVNLPGDTTLSCGEAAALIVPDLNYTNGQSGTCEISGFVPGVLSGSFDACGGTELITWEFTDSCGNAISHTQNITVEPAVVAAFMNLPGDTVLTCGEVENYVIPDLNYTNNENGPCQISGSVPGILSGTYNGCGGNLTATWMFIDSCGRTIQHVQNISVEPASEPAFLSPPADLTVSCGETDTLSFDSLAFSNNASGFCLVAGSAGPEVTESYNACGGSITVSWSFTDSCGQTISYTQNISVEPAPEPAFINPPADLTITCSEADTLTFDSLVYSNSANSVCLIEGSVAPVVTEDYDGCSGSITATWTFTDSCGRMIDYTQNISVEPAPEPAFINPPTDLTITCSEADTYSIDSLAYTNNAAGTCLIAGTAPPTILENYNSCGGSITVSWMYSDSCGRMIDYTQNISVEPAPEPAFINPPTDLTVSCGAVDTLTFDSLAYSNNSNGTCLIAGAAPPVILESYDACGGSITVSWMYLDVCGDTMQHIQNVSVESAPVAAFLNPPQDTTIACSDDYLNTIPSLHYSNNDANCPIEGDVDATQQGSIECNGLIVRTWTFTDSCDREITWTQNISITDTEPPVILNAPADTTVNCIGNLPDSLDLVWTDNCDTGGIVSPVVTSDGGQNPEVITYTWSVTDACGNTAVESQVITVFTESIVNLDASICEGDSVFFNGTAYTSAGEYTDTIPGGAAFGCDSILLISITALDHAEETIVASLCGGDTIVINNVPYFASGMYGDTIYGGASNGCDSILTITIDTLPTSFTNINETLCSGESVVINGTTYDMPGSFADTISGGASNGCDSILNITIDTLPSVTMNIQEALCPGASVAINGVLYNMAGMYIDTIHGGASNGCDSILNITIDTLPVASTNIAEALCPGESVDINGVTYDMAGFFTDTIIGGASNGCDSILYIQIDTLSFASTSIEASLCSGESVVINGVTYDIAGSFVDTISGGASNGCDSILYIQIEALPIASRNIDESLCAGESVIINGILYDIAGMYTDTIHGGASNGCDSILYIQIDTLSAVSANIQEDICPGQSVVINGVTYAMAGMYTDTIPGGGSNGCNSILYIQIDTLSAVSTNIQEDICAGQAVVINGVTYDMAGMYTDTISGGGSNGCDSILYIQIDTLSAVSTTLTPILCEDESIVINGSQYDINHPSGSDTLTSGVGCDSIVNVIVDFQTLPDVQIDPAGPFCFEDGVQTLIASPAGGVWSGDVTSDQFDPATQGAGDHQVIYTVTGDCSNADTIIVTVFPEVVISCAAVEGESDTGMDGVGTVTVVSGTPPYTIGWAGPVSGSDVLNADGTYTITGLSAGTYTITVTDANGCMDDCMFTIEFVGCTLAIDSIDILPVSCAGNADGAIQINASGGTTPYLYSIDGGTFQTQNFFTDLTPGPHTIVVHDAGGCATTTDISIPVNQGPVLQLISVTPAACGQANGGFEVKPVGGSPPYTFTVNNVSQSIGAFTGFDAGTYEVYLEDANGCMDSISVTITDEGAPMIDNVIVTNATCGQANGSILVLASGGSTPYVYSINGGPTQISNAFTGLPAGTYTVAVTDQNNCMVSQTVQIGNVGGPTIDDVTVVPALCGMTTGSVTVIASGGTGALQYSIDSGPFGNNPTFNNLGAGPHIVAVRDVNGCVTSIQVNVPNLDGPQITSAPVVHTTCGDNNGQITVNASGGLPPLFYSMNGGPFQSGNIFSGLSAGNYIITVKDENNCENQVNVIINPSVGPTVDVIIEKEHCGMGNGHIIIFGIGGIEPYTYSFNGGAYTSNDFYDHLSSDFYDICVKDAQGCIDCEEIFIDNTDPPHFDSVQVTDATCTQNIGSITIFATSFYTLEYSINGIFWQSSNVFTGLAPGVYTIYIRDQYHCITTHLVTIGPVGVPSIDSIGVTNAECLNPGALTVFASGGTGTLLYSLDNVTFQNSPIFPGLDPGSYTVYLIDESDCRDQAPATIIGTMPDSTLLDETLCEGDVLQIGNETFDTTGTYVVTLINSSGCDSTITLTLTVTPCCMVTGDTSFTTICAGDVYDFMGQQLDSTGMYTDTLVGASVDGCDSILYLNLDVIPPVMTSVTMSICEGETYPWIDTTYAESGIYVDTIPAATGCDSIVVLDLTVNPLPTADAGEDQVIPCANTPVTLTGSGDGTPHWSGPGIIDPNSFDQVVDVAGTYLFTVTSAEGCTAQDTVFVIVDTTAPSANAGPDGYITCDQDSVVLNGSGTGDNLMLTWSGPGVPAGDAHLTTLTVSEPGIYILVVTDTLTGCMSLPDTVLVNDLRVDLLSDIQSSGNIDCNQSTVTLTSAGSSTGPGITFIWLNPLNMVTLDVPSVTVSVPGTYFLFVVDTLSGCQAVDSQVVLNTIAFPPADAGEDQTLDCSLGFVLLEANPGDTSTNLIYAWSGPAGGIISNPHASSIVAAAAGEYVVTVTNTTNGCVSFDTVGVNEVQDIPVADAGPPQTINCINETAILDGSNSSSGPGYAYVWNGPGVTNVEGITIEVDQPGFYELLVMNLGNGCEDRDTTQVILEDILAGAGTMTTDPECFGDATGEIFVGPVDGGAPPYQYSLDGITYQDSALFTGLGAGTYTLFVRDSVECVWQTTVTIHEGLSLNLNIGPDLDLIIGDSAQLHAIISPPVHIDSIVWSPANVLSCTHCMNPVLTIDMPDTFVVSAIIYSGNCVAYDSLVVRVKDDYTLYVPNVFSPNNDNINDYLSVFSNDKNARVLKLEIFDRWGEKVYGRTNFPVNVPELGWDGTFKNKTMNPAVFVYVARVQFSNGSVRLVSGDITLIR